MSRKPGRKANGPETATIDEAANRLGISRNGAYLAAQRGELPTIRIGRRLLVPRVALERMLAGDAPARKIA